MSRTRKYEDACSHKVRHGDADAAMVAIESLRNAGKATEGIRPYQCSLCGLYHIGRPNKSGNYFRDEVLASRPVKTENSKEPE